MCGFAGFLSKNSISENSHVLLKEMGMAIEHRGPDSAGEWFDTASKIGLSHRRLAIVDLSKAGHQPMFSTSQRFVLSYNGEIYNHLDLRNELEKEGITSKWHGHSDTETLLAGFEHWGIRLTIEKSIGMFAFSVWDKENKRLTLGRDRLGEKPLYYGWQDNDFLFASELKALKVHPAFKSEINRDAVALLVRHNYIPAPHSIYSGINKLPPGHLLEVNTKDHNIKLHEYWSTNTVCSNTEGSRFSGSPEEAVVALDNYLRDAVKQQMMADVPLGAFLSGGIDSSAVVALMQAQSDKPVKTFSIGFHEEGYNEAIHAKNISKHLGTEHTELYITSDDAMAVIPILAKIYDEPFADPSQIPTFLVSKLAKSKVTVSLSGDGGDEIFCGYSRYIKTYRLWMLISKLPRSIRFLLSKALRVLSIKAWDKLNGLFINKLKISNFGFKVHKAAEFVTAESIADFYRGVMSHSYEPSKLVVGAKDVETVFSSNKWRFDTETDMEKIMALDSASYLPDDILAKVDRASMAVSLESRIPFLSHKVVEFAWKLPLNYKLKNNEAKWCLKEVLYQYVPKSLLDRPKMGFNVPICMWLRGPLKEWASSLLDEDRLRTEGFFDPELVSSLWEEHQSGKNDWQCKLWNILMFQVWYEKNK